MKHRLRVSLSPCLLVCLSPCLLISQVDAGPTSWPVVLLAIYCALIVLASLVGGWLPTRLTLTHTRLETMMSLVGGLMLGIGLFHMLPHAFAELGSLDRAVRWMMFGLLLMFFLIRTFHFHQHNPVDVRETKGADEGERGRGGEGEITKGTGERTVELPVVVSHACGHDHDHDHGGHRHHHDQGNRHTHRLSWLGVFLGLALHTLIDGLALGASIQADAVHAGSLSLFGLGTFLAILLHKPLDAVSITSLMVAGGWPAGWRNAINAGFALMCPLGAGLFFLGVRQFSDQQHEIIGCALAFAAGVFLCISLGDLLPEMQFHSHNRTRLSVLLLTGVAVAYLIGYLEPEHAHRHEGHRHAEGRAGVGERGR